YFKDTVKAADWEKVLMSASDGELATIANRLAGRTKTGPKGYETSTVFAPAAKDKAIAAVAVVQLARKLEPYASFEAYDADGNPKKPVSPPDDLVATARAGMKAAKDPFLTQRYAFLTLRATFYRRDWPAAIGFYDKNQALLATPSVDLAWNARHYAA